MNTHATYRELAVARCCISALMIFNYWNVAKASEPRSPQGNFQQLADLYPGQLTESVTHVGSLSSSYTALAEHDGISATTLPTDSTASVDKTVIGRSFQVSNSVDSRCKHEPSLCADVLRNLAKLASEPRDNRWAAEMEKLIQTNITEQEQKQYSIRNIECRMSVCAVEVASIFGPYLIGRDDQLHTSLRPGLATLGAYETDASGARVTVTVETFTRR
jgi:hypothetical protein